LDAPVTTTTGFMRAKDIAGLVPEKATVKLTHY
jgi:hypothetical protein